MSHALLLCAVIARSEFGLVIAEGGDVDALLKALDSVIESRAVASALNAFSMAVILSSFIGVGLGVFDYLADLFKFDNERSGRTKSWALTFLPPLLAWKVRAAQGDKGEGFRALGGLLMIALVIGFGVLTAAFHLLNMAGLLPVYQG